MLFSAFKRSLSSVSIFHNPSSPPSKNALALLQSALSSPYPPSKSKSPLSFNLEVVESPPTPDQLSTILSYVAPKGNTTPSSVFLSAHPSSQSGHTENMTSIAGLAKENPNAIKWPIVVDWDAGQASVGDVEGVKRILETLRKKRDGEIKEELDKPMGWFS